jgi:hypothetical protein
MAMDSNPMSATGEITAERTEIRRLVTLMRDPRYWRDRDPTLVRAVTQGFKQLHQGQNGQQGGRPPSGLSASI